MEKSSSKKLFECSDIMSPNKLFVPEKVSCEKEDLIYNIYSVHKKKLS